MNNQTKNNLINKFSPHLFWDVDIQTINPEKDKKWLIGRVLEYGLYNDWLLIKNQYGIKKIVDIAINIRDLSQKSVSFLSTLSGFPKDKFICYSTKQSQPNFWNS